MREIKKVLFIVNPISGNQDKDALIDFVEKQLKNRQLDLISYSTKGENDKEAIRQILGSQEIDRILVAGGDGTIKMVAEVVIAEDKNIPIGIFPEGSANGLALNLEIPESKEEQLDVALGENILHIDVVKINDDFSLHIADFGVNAELIKNFEKHELRGKIGYLIQSIPTLVKSNYPFEFTIETQEGVYEKEGTVLAIANCQKYGTGARINPDGKMNDGKFELILFKNLNLIDLIKTLTDNLPLSSDFAETFICNSAKIKCKKGLPFQVDGEYIGEVEQVEVSIMKKILPVTVSNSFAQENKN